MLQRNILWYNKNIKFESIKYKEIDQVMKIKMCIKGSIGRSVVRILEIEGNICLYWIKKYTKEIEVKM